MILRILFFIQTFLNYCKGLSTEKYKRYINIIIIIISIRDAFLRVNSWARWC